MSICLLFIYPWMDRYTCAHTAIHIYIYTHPALKVLCSYN